MKEKVFFIIFKELSHARNCLRPESAPLNSYIYFGLTPRLISRFQNKTIKEPLIANQINIDNTASRIYKGKK